MVIEYYKWKNVDTRQIVANNLEFNGFKSTRILIIPKFEKRLVGQINGWTYRRTDKSKFPCPALLFGQRPR